MRCYTDILSAACGRLLSSLSLQLDAAFSAHMILRPVRRRSTGWWFTTIRLASWCKMSQSVSIHVVVGIYQKQAKLSWLAIISSKPSYRAQHLSEASRVIVVCNNQKQVVNDARSVSVSVPSHHRPQPYSSRHIVAFLMKFNIIRKNFIRQAYTTNQCDVHFSVYGNVPSQRVNVL